MVWLKRIVVSVVILLCLSVAGIFATGNGPALKIVMDVMLNAPALPFDPEDTVAAPDYSLEENWAALASRQDLKDQAPEGYAVSEQGSAPVDVFYIHPTGFLKGSNWIYSMDPDTSSEENTKWMIANQASAYNGCCNVYAPRYRQASIFAYFASDDTTRDEVLAFAYQDVERAFQYFLDNFNDGRPFVIASHSQGTHHAVPLLRNKVDGTELASRMIAAYIIGGGLNKTEFDDIQDITLCDSPAQLHCAVHWDTFSMASLDDAQETGQICVNPLTWKVDGGLAGNEEHVGALGTSGDYNLEFSGDDKAQGVEFGALGAPLPNFLEAQCAGGKLYVTDQSDTPFGAKGSMGGSYHGLDYPLFYMDIRENVQLRVDTFLAEQEAAE
ncbi:MAG: hypothetical protein ACI9JM_002079 [Halioglobus sp.]|jgi:hypothetical protein